MKRVYCVFCPSPVLAAGEIDGDPACPICGALRSAEYGSEFTRYPEPQPPVRVITRVRVRHAVRGVRTPRRGYSYRSPEHAAILAEFAGKMSDSAVGKLIGRTCFSVYCYRRRNGIPAWRDDRAKSAQVAAENRRRGELTWARCAAYAGHMTDIEIERRIGIKRATVAAMRKVRGVPAFRAEKSHPREKVDAL